MASRGKALELLRNLRSQLDTVINAEKDNPVIINALPDGIRPWKEGVYSAGDVRMYNDIPRKCITSHDSTGNSAWNPDDAPSLWMQYHGTTSETARAWIAPTGAHDMYKAGEYMVFTDGVMYKCTIDTDFSPIEYPAAWKKNI